MDTREIAALRSLTTFPALIAYLRDRLDWPIEVEDADDLTFDYDPAELGLSPEHAVKIESIKQLRPLADGQPWGIFYVQFETKRLPVVVLRRILHALVAHRRQQDPDRPVWRLDDLMFISTFGAQALDEREIAFAHFHQEAGDLPTLRVLGWDGADTPLKLDHVADTLRQRLGWPADPGDHDAWRDQWSGAFRHRLGHVIRTADALAERLAELARGIRDAATTLMDHESEHGPLRRLHQAFQTALIHDLSEAEFADTYAQTITYGLLTAAISRTEMSEGRYGTALLASDVTEMVPITNPFLREMLATFLQAGGRKGGIDFDELGIQDVVDLLRGDETDLPAILRDFGNRTQGEDPVIHFYEHFLAAYDKKLKVQRGIFYTPQPVVSYIVRSVHELLQTEFGLEAGLASTVTWGEMAARHPDLSIPEGADPESPFVTVLDPATGTATFLVEAIDVIHRTLTAKWREQRLSEAQQRAAWNEYVPRHLLPRLYGYELMMAPYAIAHMKVPLKLKETGFTAWDTLRDEDRVRVYLTNALEPASDQPQQYPLDFNVTALAHEAQAVNEVKRRQRFTVVVGNPPYASTSANLTPELRRMVNPYRFVDGRKIHERSMLQFEKNIQDDYVKFFAFSQAQVENSGIGVLALITNHSFLDAPTLRGLRWNLVQKSAKSWYLDLHGNMNKAEKTPNGEANENVFDIRQGVCITILLHRRNLITKSEIRVGELWGSRREKYEELSSSTAINTSFTKIDPEAPHFYFVRPDGGQVGSEWHTWPTVPEIFTKRSTGTETGFDDLLVDFTLDEVKKKVDVFLDPKRLDSEIAEMYRVSAGHAKALFERRSEIPSAKLDEFKGFQIRAYDYRFACLRRSLLKTNSFNVMLDLSPKTPGLVTTRQTKEAFSAFAVGSFCGHKVISSYDRSYIFPLFARGRDSLFPRQIPCITRPVIQHFRSMGKGTLAQNVDDSDSGLAHEIFRYVLAVLNSPTYTAHFEPRLKRDWPRVPLTSSRELFRALARLGGELVALHLMESPKLEQPLTTYAGPPDPRVEKVSYARETVWLDKAQTRGFCGVPEEVWNFYIGGYQVCEKWLKDRGPKKGQPGRVLTPEDLEHYQRIVVALHETIRLMAEIDEVIEEHGGWPIE